MSYWIHPDAEAELGDAAIYYAERVNRRIAEAFLAEFERVRDLLIENQHRGPNGDLGLRVYHFNRFPYSVIYGVDVDRGPQIHAIAHQSRDPLYWTPRI